MTNFFTFYRGNFFAALLLTLAFIFVTGTHAYGITYTSNAVTGNWSDGTSWVGGTAPAGLTTDVIVIVSGANITVTSSTSCGSITINATATANSLTINGGVTLSVFGAVALNSPTAAVTSTLAIGDGILTCVSIAIPGSATANRVAQVSIATGTINCSGNITFSGTAAQAQLVFTDVGIINMQGNLGAGGTFNAAGAGTVNFNGTSAQTAGGYTYYNLNIDNPVGVTLLGASNITNLNIGDVTPNSIFNDGGFVITPAAGNALNLNSGTYNLGSAGVGTTWPAWTNPTINTGTTIGYVSGVAQPVSALPAYQYLTFTGVGTKTVANNTTTVLDWNDNSPTTTTTAIITVGGNLNGTGSISSSGMIYVAGNWTNTGTLTGTGTVNFNGGSNQVINNGLAAYTFYNVEISGGQSLTVNNPTTSLTVNNLLLTSGNFTGPATLTINGNLTMTSGTFTAGNTIGIAGNWTDNAGGFIPGTSTVTFTGNSSSITTAAGINDQTFYNLVVAKTAGQTLTVNLPSSLTVNNFTETSGNFSFTQLVTLNINGNVLLSNGAFTAGNTNTPNMTINVDGNWANNDGTPISPSTSIVNFTGATQTIGGNVATTFYIIVISDGANITLNGGSGITATSLTIGNGNSGVLNAGGEPITVSGSVAANGAGYDGLTINGGGTLNANASIITDKWDFINNGTFSSGTSTVIFSIANIAGNLTKTVTGNDPQFYNLTMTGAAAAETLDLSQISPVTVLNNITLTTGTMNASGQLFIGGNWSTAGAAGFINNNGMVTFNGSGAQLIGGAVSPGFYDMEIANTSGAVTVGVNPLTILDHLFIDNAATFIAAAAGFINIGNIWENDGGTFTPSTGTVNFNGSNGNTSGSITTNGNSPNQTFNNIFVTTTGGTIVDATPLTSLTVNGIFKLQSGGFNAPGTMTVVTSMLLNSGIFNASIQLFISGAWSEAPTTFNNNNGLVTFNGSGAQGITGTDSSQIFYDVEVGNTGTLTIANSHNITVVDNLTIDAGAKFASGALDTINIGYQWINNGGMFNPSTGTVNFNGGWYNYITGSSTSATFNNLTVTNTSLWLDATALATLNVTGNFTMTSGGLNPPVTMTVDGNVLLTSGTFFCPTTVLNVGGNWINNGDGGARGSFDTYDCSCNSVVNFNGAGAQSIEGTATAQTFSDVTVDKTGAGAAGTLSNSTVTALLISDNFTLTAGTFASALPNSAITINNSGSPSSFTFTSGTFNVSSPSSVVTVNGPGLQTGGSVTSGGTFNYFDPNQSGQTVITGSYDTLIFDDINKTLSPGTITINAVLIPGGGTGYTTTGNTIIFPGAAHTQTIPVFNFDGIATGTGYGGLTTTNPQNFAGNLAVNGVLSYAGGVGDITLGSMNIVLGPTGSIIGVPGAGHMIVLNSTGRLIKVFPTGAQSYTYPVGPVAGTYTPVTLNFDNVITSGDVGVTLNPGTVDPNAVAPPAPATNWLKQYWVFDPNTTNITFDYYSATVSYLASAYNTSLTAGAGGESTMGAMVWNGTSWLTNAVVTGRTPLNPTASFINTLGDLTFATCTPLAKTAGPTSQYVCTSGTSSINFSVGVSGDVAGYQWYQDGVPVTDTGIYSGGNTSQLTITNGTAALNGKTYYCVVTAECSGSFTSDTATIHTVTGTPSSVINVTAYPPTYHPGDKVVIVATDTGNLTDLHYAFVEAFAQGASYWFTDLQNTTSDTLTLDSVTAYGTSIKSPGVTWLFVYANNACGEVFGDFYPIQVIPPTTSSNPTVCGDTDGYITFPGLITNNQYTIDYDKNGVAQAQLTLTTNANGLLTIPNLGAGTYSDIVLTVLNQGSSSPTAPADPVTLYDPCGGLTPFTVTYNNGISTLGGTVNACAGIYNIGLAYGDTGVIYNLYEGTNLVATKTLTSPGAFNFNYTPLSGNTYTVTGTISPNTVNMNGTVIVNANPTAVISNTGLAGCASTGVLLGTAGSTAGSGTISSYQWADSAGNITGATGSAYTAMATGSYAVIITNSHSCSTTSPASEITINANPIPVINYTTLTGCANPGVALGTTGSGAGSGTISSYQWADSTGNIIVATDSTYRVTASGNYSVIITNSNSCSATSSAIPVLINPNPAPPALTAVDSIFCSGDSTQVCAADSFSSYLWSTGATGYCATAKQEGNYWVSVTASDGCTAVSRNKYIATHAVSSVSITVKGDTVSSSGASAYQWLFNSAIIDSATLSYYVATQSGNYTVLATDSFGCQAFSSIATIVINGIIEVGNTPLFEIYPNPATSKLQITVDDKLRGKEYELYDICGKLVYTGIIKQERSTLEISTIEPGLYFIKMEGLVQRFIKQ